MSFFCVLKISKSATVKEGDPGIIVLPGSNEAIHEALGLPAVENIQGLQQGRLNTFYVHCISPTNSFPGTTREESRQNLFRWLDGIVRSCAREECLVESQDKSRVEGAYHRMQQEEHSMTEAKLSQYVAWSVQCQEAGCSAGRFLSIEGAGQGYCVMIAKKLGPFVTY